MKLRRKGDDTLELSVEQRPALSLPNPFAFAFRQKTSQHGSDFFPPPSLVAITHGDLHGGNVLVRERGGTWLIDFYKTRRGPALRDFAELECDIKFDRVETNSLRVRHDLEAVRLPGGVRRDRVGQQRGELLVDLDRDDPAGHLEQRECHAPQCGRVMRLHLEEERRQRLPTGEHTEPPNRHPDQRLAPPQAEL